MKFFDMIKIKLLITSLMAMLFISVASAQGQEQKVMTPEEAAAKEADRLGEQLKLEYWQIFYVDSTLQHDYKAMEDEMKALQSSKVGNISIYTSVQDKWMDQIDATFKRIFSSEQWAAYLKSGAARLQKQREKRRQKAEAAK